MAWGQAPGAWGRWGRGRSRGKLCGCTASGTAYKSMSFVVREGPTLWVLGPGDGVQEYDYLGARCRRCKVHGTRTTYKGMPVRVWGVPQLRGPFGAGCTAPWAAYKGMPFGVCAVPQQRGLAGVGCTATGTAYKGISYWVSRGPAGSWPRRLRVHGNRNCVQGYVI